ncbi:murein hydrolase activator EnvC family protein [Desulfurivibrio sp. D14AmB]|uniref:murein hydrolase activator EnvC family protein n=1 Tax=Desulfurivibrio sp. D14AmB TaxID=3374370 RepID=UPI00376F141A
MGPRPINRLLLPVVLLALLLGQLPLAAEEASLYKRRPPTSEDYARQGEDYTRQLERLHQGLAEQEAMAVEAWQREQSLMAELAQLDHELTVRQERQGELEDQIVRQRELIARQREALDQALQELNQAEEHLRARLAAAYRMGATGLLNILFSAQSLPELLDFQESFHHIIEHDRHSFARYRQNIANLEETGQELDRKQAELLAISEELQRQEEELQKARGQHAALLRRVQIEKQLYQQARQEIARATEKLRAALTDLQARMEVEAAAQRLRPAPLAGDFAALRGRLVPPTSGPILSRFGQKEVTGRPTALPRDPSKGITIAGAPGAGVYALARGTVAFADNVEAYGKTVIIDHGNEYFSLVAGLDDILTLPRAEVRQGEIIGRLKNDSGEGAVATGPVLYLEIRWGLRPIDPLPWLRGQ